MVAQDHPPPHSLYLYTHVQATTGDFDDLDERIRSIANKTILIGTYATQPAAFVLRACASQGLRAQLFKCTAFLCERSWPFSESIFSLHGRCLLCIFAIMCFCCYSQYHLPPTVQLSVHGRCLLCVFANVAG